jgi:hypothetical protein
MTQAPDIGELVRQGVAVIVATCDATHRPAVTKGWGPVLSADGARLTLCIDAPAGSDTRTNLAAGSPVAVTLSRPTSYVSVQLKGPLRTVTEPDGDARRIAAEHIAAFVAETSALGVPEDVIHATVGDELVLVAFDVVERYDQTPGPGAGRPL